MKKSERKQLRELRQMNGKDRYSSGEKLKWAVIAVVIGFAVSFISAIAGLIVAVLIFGLASLFMATERTLNR